MAVKRYNPTSPGRRFQSRLVSDELTRGEPEKSLVKPLKKSGGRNASGRITQRHRGGGHKRRFRLVDFRRDKDGAPGRVASVEYDPNRTANIALIVYADGDKRYIVAAAGVQVGDTVVAGSASDIQPGNALPLASIPVGTVVHNVELKPGKGAQLVRSAGSGAQVVAKEGNYALLRLPSGELRNVRIECRATIGRAGNASQ